MSFLGQIFAGDEELGKKDDDHRPLNGDAKSAAWSTRKTVRGPRWRRVIYGICGVLFIYLFIQNIPTDFGSNNLPPDSRAHQGPIDTKKPSSSTEPPKRKPPRPPAPLEAEEHYHEGPIKFYNLAASLHAVARMGGQQQSNKNVLFAASSLKSVSEIVPLACEMARWERNDVHLAVMGRADMEIEEIKQINGAVEDCNVNWHDARPDFSRWSTDFRMEVSVTAGMEHIQTFVHPQMIIIDDPSREDAFFVDAVRSKVTDLGKAVIELPRDAAETMMWMTRLDSGSLAAWPTAYVEIFIQAPKDSSGSLVRLLKSIENADYFGARRPHLTIELPAEIDRSTWQFLQNFVWPPLDWSGAPHASQVTLRHRIPRRTVSEQEASARLVESFYPVRTDDSSVLLLSPQVELSPLYYHYLIYTLLEYKYSDYNRKTKEAPNLMGISLVVPSTFPNDSTEFRPPRRSSSSGVDREATPFRWQSPSADAVLYFGNKWMEFHSFLSNRLSKAPTNFPKYFRESHPAWLEYMLELMRARGYSLLYPNFQSEDGTLATVHSDLYQVPEEFLNKKSRSSSPLPSTDSDFTADPASVKPPTKDEGVLLNSNLVSLLPAVGDLPELGNLPLLGYDGEKITDEQSGILSSVFSNTFRAQTGACESEKEQTSRLFNIANDLFCHLEEIYDYHATAVGTSNVAGQAPIVYTPAAQSGDNLKSLEAPPNDEDVISQQAASEAKISGEMAGHLNRNNGKAGNAPFSSTGPAHVVPTRDFQKEAEEKELYESLHPGKSELDANDEWQSQFRGQLERQRKQAMGRKKGDDTKTVESKPSSESDTGKEPQGDSETGAGKTSGDTTKPTMSRTKEDKQVATHGSFNKEAPKPAKEDEVAAADATQAKGPGW